MKKRLVALAFALMLLCCMALPALANSSDGKFEYIWDDADILTYEEWASLEDKAFELYGKYGLPVYIVIVEDYTDFGDGGIWNVADGIWEANGFGVPGEYERYDGFMLLMSMDERDFDNGSYGLGQYVLTDYGKLVIEDDFLGYFRNDNWYSGFAAYIDGVEDCIIAYNNGAPIDGDIGEYGYDEDGNYVGNSGGFSVGKLIANILAPLGAAGIACGVGASKMKSVHKKSEASEYVVPGSMRLHTQYDMFAYATQTRRRIESSSRSGGGGSFHSGGGSSHHSGKF